MADAWESATKRGHSQENENLWAKATETDAVCDRCDRNHRTELCPHFRQEREDHPDALVRNHQIDPSHPRAVPIVSARLIRQPRDGSCLFHALAYGIKANADQLRLEIAFFIGTNTEFEVSGTPLKKWIAWDSGEDVKTYVKNMAWSLAWGGGIEIAVCSHLANVAIDVYEPRGAQFRLLSSFQRDEPRGRVSVCYTGRNHYDALDQVI